MLQYLVSEFIKLISTHEGIEENHEKTSVRIAGLWLKISVKEL
jgi:hypothetical protein